MANETITIEEINRIEGGLRVTYVLWRGQCLRRERRRGRPHYETVHGFRPSTFDRVRRRQVSVMSQVARRLLSVV